MPKRDNNVLLFEKLPARKDLRAAVARIIRSVQLEHHETDEETAQNIGVSVGTIRNARNEDSDLNALTIAAIGKRYGPEAILPYMNLFGSRAVLNEPDEAVNALPVVTSLAHRLATSRAAGASVAVADLAQMLPDLRAAARAINALMTRADNLGIAA